MMLDLDRFKQVNDTLGHQAGDELLRQVAQRLERIVGSKGEIGRLGGDEFQIILPDMDDRGDLGSLAQSLIQMVSQPYSINGSRAIVGTSVGIAIAPYDGIEAQEVAGAGDLALYAAKGGGRGQYRFYSSDLKDGANLRRQIEEDLRDAIATDALEMHYQPLVDPRTNKVKSFESLVRWNHPEKGWISPADFVPVAEDSGQIIALGEWAMRRACRDAAQWPEELIVAVNVSAVQFASHELPDLVEDCLSSTGLSPDRFEIELTESVFIGDPVATQDMFRRLKGLGIQLALDDFGTGYSSLGYLRNAPFDKIKIDQSFVRGACEGDNNNAAIINAIVSLANALDMITVAEGVEAHDELDLMRELGATRVQGWIYSKALPHADVMSKLATGELDYEPHGPAKSRAERRSMFRRVGVIHEDHRYEVVMRNLSRTGARIEGMLNVPEGTELVLDLGNGQLGVAVVRRSEEAAQGLEFETSLISDGADGLCTRHRVSPYALASAGMPLAALPSGDYPLVDAATSAASGRPRFLQVETTGS
jgi:diguanylate cyclase (GGDEF)-like protein